MFRMQCPLPPVGLSEPGHLPVSEMFGSPPEFRRPTLLRPVPHHGHHQQGAAEGLGNRGEPSVTEVPQVV